MAGPNIRRCGRSSLGSAVWIVSSHSWSESTIPDARVLIFRSRASRKGVRAVLSTINLTSFVLCLPKPTSQLDVGRLSITFSTSLSHTSEHFCSKMTSSSMSRRSGGRTRHLFLRRPHPITYQRPLVVSKKTAQVGDGWAGASQYSHCGLPAQRPFLAGPESTSKEGFHPILHIREYT